MLCSWGLLFVNQLKKVIVDEITLGILISIGRNGINSIASPKVGMNACLSAVAPVIFDFFNLPPDGRSDVSSSRTVVGVSMYG